MKSTASRFKVEKRNEVRKIDDEKRRGRKKRAERRSGTAPQRNPKSAKIGIKHPHWWSFADSYYTPPLARRGLVSYKSMTEQGGCLGCLEYGAASGMDIEMNHKDEKMRKEMEFILLVGISLWESEKRKKRTQ